jgi:hypothetical protein
LALKETSGEAIFEAINNGGGAGLSGRHDSSGNYGVVGSSNYGLYGQSRNGRAVYGKNQTTGYYGYIGGLDFAGYFENPNTNFAYLSGAGAAIYGKDTANGNFGWIASPSYGLYGSSSTNHGIVGLTDSGDSSHAAILARNDGAGAGIIAEAGSGGLAAEFLGNVLVRSRATGLVVMELGEGLDYAEGFHVSSKEAIRPGSVLIIDAENPGKLRLSNKAYDTRVAGIVAGAKGLGSGVRLGIGQFDYDVALAGRVYCSVDASREAIRPGDLLTTSSAAGYAMKVQDFSRCQGAVLGKSMQHLEKGKRGQILVLVTLQ